MNVSISCSPFPFIIVDEFYEIPELNLVHAELDALSDSLKENPFINKEESFYRVEKLKNNTSLFLDNHYSNRRDESWILRFNRKLFHLLSDLSQNVTKDNWFFSNLDVKDDFTLISYYENGGHFLSHRDNNILTSLTWLFHQPKKFSGGNLIFPDYDIEVECLYNRMIAFPGMIRHQVTDINLTEDESSHGRWCITQFAHQSTL